MANYDLKISASFKDSGAARGINNISNSTRNLSSVAGVTANSISHLGNQLLHIGVNVASKVINIVTNLIHKLIDLTKKVVLLGTAISGYIGRQATNAFAEFEKAIASASSIAAKSEEQFASLNTEMQNIAIELAGPSFKTPTGIAEGMYTIVSAGKTATNTIRGMTKEAIYFAEAFNADVKTSSELILAMKNVYGERTPVAEILGASIQKSQMTPDRLATALPYVAASANRLKVSLFDLTAALSTVVDQGIDASMAGTQMRMAFAQLINPTKAGRTALAKYGLTVEDVRVDARGLGAVLKTLHDANMDLADMQELVGLRAADTIGILSQNIDQYNKMRRSMAGANSVFTIQQRIMNTVAGKWEEFTGNLHAAYILLGREMKPELLRGINILKSWIDEFVKIDNLKSIARDLGAAFISIAQTIKDTFTPKNISLFIKSFTHLVSFALSNIPILLKFFNDLGGRLSELKDIDINLLPSLPGAMDTQIFNITNTFIEEMKTAWKPIFDAAVVYAKVIAPQIAQILMQIGDSLGEGIFKEDWIFIKDSMKEVLQVAKLWASIMASIARFINNINKGATSTMDLLHIPDKSQADIKALFGGLFLFGLPVIRTVGFKFGAELALNTIKALKAFAWDSHLLQIFKGNKTISKLLVRLFHKDVSKLIKRVEQKGFGKIFIDSLDELDKVKKAPGSLTEEQLEALIKKINSRPKSIFERMTNFIKNRFSKPGPRITNIYKDLFKDESGFLNITKLEAKLGSVGKILGSMGKILGKIALPLAIILEVWEAIIFYSDLFKELAPAAVAKFESEVGRAATTFEKIILYIKEIVLKFAESLGVLASPFELGAKAAKWMLENVLELFNLQPPGWLSAIYGGFNIKDKLASGKGIKSPAEVFGSNPFDETDKTKPYALPDLPRTKPQDTFGYAEQKERLKKELDERMENQRIKDLTEKKAGLGFFGIPTKSEKKMEELATRSIGLEQDIKAKIVEQTTAMRQGVQKAMPAASQPTGDPYKGLKPPVRVREARGYWQKTWRAGVGGPVASNSYVVININGYSGEDIEKKVVDGYYRAMRGI